VIDAFEIRVRDIMEDKVDDEDLMSTFKRRLAAGEIDVHHHHAEYQDPEAKHEHTHSHDHSHEHSHSHSHGHSHSHSHTEKEVEPHSHGVYKHIAHPLGPRTMIGEGICNCFMSQFPQELLDEESERIKNGVQGEALAHKK
jgi:sirohydrochlorin cobaltochelatase